MKRRHMLKVAVAAGAAMVSGPALAQWAPRRPVNLIVPFAAGGGTDNYARAFASAAREVISAPIVIVNRPGAGGINGAIEAAGAPADGSNLMLHSAGAFLLSHMYLETDVNPFDSFRTISQIGEVLSALIVPATSPYETIEDLIAAAKAENGSLRWSHNGRGGTIHVNGELFLRSQGISAVDVPFSGGGSVSRAAILSGEVDYGVIGLQQVRGFEDGIRVLAVFSDQRDRIQDQYPTFSEQGVQVPFVSSPVMLFAPNGVSEDFVRDVDEGVRQIAEQDVFEETLREQGAAVIYRDGATAREALLAMKNVAEPIIASIRGS